MAAFSYFSGMRPSVAKQPRDRQMCVGIEDANDGEPINPSDLTADEIETAIGLAEDLISQLRAVAVSA